MPARVHNSWAVSAKAGHVTALGRSILIWTLGLRTLIIWLLGGPSEGLMAKRLEKIKCQLAALCSVRCSAYPEITAVGRDEACWFPPRAMWKVKRLLSFPKTTTWRRTVPLESGFLGTDQGLRVSRAGRGAAALRTDRGVPGGRL